MYMLTFVRSEAAFMPQGQSWAVATDTIWPQRLKYFLVVIYGKSLPLLRIWCLCIDSCTHSGPCTDGLILIISQTHQAAVSLRIFVLNSSLHQDYTFCLPDGHMAHFLTKFRSLLKGRLLERGRLPAPPPLQNRKYNPHPNPRTPSASSA